MADETENIEQQIDETKASLLGKLEALEAHVADAVQTTSETVSGTVGAVKETVETVKEKVQDASDFLNIRRQAQNNPWTVFGTSVVAGCLTGYLLGGSSRTRSDSGRKGYVAPEGMLTPPNAPLAEAARSQPRDQPPPEKPSWLREQLGNLSGLAIGALMGAVRDLAASNMPDGLGKSISQELDRLTTSLGAKPIAGPILPRLEEWLGPKEESVEAPPPRPAAASTVRQAARPPKQPAV